jgi:hypothetical protein
MRAQIWVEQAEADLAASLDPSQQWRNEFPANASTSPLPVATAASLLDAPEKTQPAATPLLPMSDLARRAKADADRAEYDAEEARRKLAVAQGKYVVAEDAARAWGRELVRFIAEIETFLSSTLARSLADAHGLDWKPLSVEIREKFRAFRGTVSEAARTRREAIERDEALPSGGAADG